jgi:GAF domain-containing protein
MEGRFKTLITKVGDGLSGWAVQHSQAVRVYELANDPRYIETEPGLHSGLYIPLQIGDRIVGVISIESELPAAFTESDERLIGTLANQAAIALENARLHEETLHQLKQLQALHSIDQAIAGSFDQRVILDVLLTQTLSQLNADAAAIFPIQPHQVSTLQYFAGKGFHTHLIETASLKLGSGIAGEAVARRGMIHIRGPEERESQPFLTKLWSEEGFKCMEAIPLISKGEVKGVMSVFHRKEFTPDPAWTDFLETLAGQAAIAMDTTQLFDSLQRSNMEMAVAYEATIEGWSQAMDLRDKETEGHTQRVTGMAVQLAKAMQLNEEEIAHMRRGALLHDIGKLGVPDHILLKADNLTDEEWLIMKKHPQFAYNMLHSIAYLKHSLDIPYCHHEKWDGTGYPRGLKGEQIPLAARIFAIVDVWDALMSDRPYRKAWSKPDALQYLREQSGKHFDPQVVKTFFLEHE